MMDSAIIFLLISLAVTVIGIISVYTFHVSTIDKFKLLVSYFGGASMLLVIYNLYINFKSNERIEKNRIAYNTIENIRNNYLAPQKELLINYPEGYFLYASMNQDTDLKLTEPKNYDPIKRKQVEVYASLRIFQSVEDFLSTAAYDLTGIYIWLNNYLMWMQSPILRHYWSILNFNYSKDTRALMQRIIEESDYLIQLRKEKGKLTTQDYDKITNNFNVHYR